MVNSKQRKRILILVALGFFLYIMSPLWVRVWLGAGSVFEMIRDETVGDKSWQAFNAIKRAEGKISREDVRKRLGEPVESVPPGSPIPASLAADYELPKRDDSRGGLLIYESVRPIGFCFIYFNADGIAEEVILRSLD